MKNYSCLLTLSFLLITSTLLADGMTKIYGQISSPREQIVHLKTYMDLITLEPIQPKSYLTHTDKFHFQIELIEPVIATIQHGTASFEIFLEPGDSLHLSFDAWDAYTTLEFSGRGADNNIYFRESAKRFQRFNDDFVTHKMTCLSPEDFKRYLDTVRQKKLAYFYKYEKELTLSDSFEKYAVADIEFWWANHLMRYRWEHAFYNKIPPPMELPDAYYDFLTEINVNNDAAIVNQQFYFFLEEYLAYKNSKNKKLTGGGYNQPPKFNGAEQYLKGKAKYLVIANELYEKCKNRQTYSIGNDVKKFVEECPYDVYVDIVRREYKKANGISAGTLAPDFELYDQNGNLVSMSSFKGKVVYLDFWATWCAPCTYELLHSKPLKERFKNKEVVFLYVSLDSNIDTWKSFLARHNPGGIHLFAKGRYESDVAAQYSVRGLPSFFLINKDGLLSKVPAKRSTEPGIVREINEVLSE